MKLKTLKNRRIIIAFTILGFLSLNIFFLNLNTNQNSGINHRNNDDNLDKNLKLQDLASDNTYSGIGAPWNVTHWANRTDYNLEIEFENNTYDILEIPLTTGWEGYTLNAKINNLFDKRNWCNGSFNFGTDDNIETPDDDTELIENNFQNWTFGYEDVITYPAPPPPDWFVNPMSGNYLDTTYGPTDGHDCLELRIDGMDLSGDYYYDQGDRCWWNSSFEIPRGKVIDSKLEFEVKAIHIMDFNDFELRFYLNNERIYSIGGYNIKQLHGTSWGSFSIPQGLWTNSSNVYTNPVNSSVIDIRVELRQLIECGYGSGFTNYEYHQIFIDNVKLTVKAEAKPSQIQLKMNEHTVNDIVWGKGTVNQVNNWTTSLVQVNYSSTDVGELGGYIIDLNSDINLYVRKDSPETNYETNTGSLGTGFSVNNNSIVNWECYSYFAVPTGYQETEMRLQFPTDVNITWISEPQDPNTNRLSLCDNSTQGLLIIPVNAISTTPDGYWRIEATSPNYCERLTIYNNVTGEWLQNNTFLSGDFINITGKITDSSLISSYIQQTEAQLHIKFPNGTVWYSQNQLKSPDSNGYIYFDNFQIPSLPPNYEVGEYQAIITWNNSYISGLNETGVICKDFTIIHKSLLISDQYFYDEIFEGEMINLKVSFNDKENYDAIQNAIVYLDNFSGGRQYFSEISPGYYFLEFDTTGGVADNNTLTIYANSTSYTNSQVNVSVELIQQTVLTAEEYPTMQVIWNDNFTIHLNYTMKSTGDGISTMPTNNWLGETHTVEGNPGEYNITCNSSAYEVNKIHSLIINADKEGYESKTIIIGIFLIKRQINMSVYIDSLKVPELYQAKKSFHEVLSVSVRISDTVTSDFLSGEVLTLISENYIQNLTYTADFWYNLSIPCSPSNFSLGLNSIDIRFIKDNYEICIFSFQLLINQIELTIETIGFEDTINAEKGETITVQLQLLDPNTNKSVENASITYSWKYGIGSINQTTPGMYQASIILPEDIQGNYKFELIITPDNSTYRTTIYSFIVIIGDPIPGGNQLPSILLWIIIAILVSIVSVLGALSMRSYVILPRKRKKESELLSKTQRFKDLKNIQAIVVVHKLSGIPIYSKSYSILEKHKKELFSGFIQAITTVGEEFSEREASMEESKDSSKGYGIEKIIELDFKYFYCLIADKDDIRVVFILREKSSERLKSQVSNLILALNLKLSIELENWDGSLDRFEEVVPLIINEYFELHYKGSFRLPGKINLFQLRKDKSLNKLEVRTLNVIQSISKRNNNIVNLDNVIELVHEENKDLIIVAIESLIEKKFILPINS
ncbi:MAG: hypothetical protein ACFE94_13470 [Candidatus Hodarchaeota archaeon]